MLDMLNVKEICLRASALQLIVTVKDKSQSALAPCQVLLHNAENTSCFLKENSGKDNFTLEKLSINFKLINYNIFHRSFTRCFYNHNFRQNHISRRS